MKHAMQNTHRSNHSNEKTRPPLQKIAKATGLCSAFVRESTNPSEGCQANCAAGVCCMQVTIESKDDSCTVTLFLLISLISLGSDGWCNGRPNIPPIGQNLWRIYV